MELVIKLDEEDYISIKHAINSLIENGIERASMSKVCLAILDGTPLPKGHGDLIDVNRKITVPVYNEQYEEWGEVTLTVREALNKWSDEGITIKDVVILADKESEVSDADSN